ncbi:MAG: FG-GAP-like repeat-containing protein [Candidatus Eisenbacteria bacterium]
MTQPLRNASADAGDFDNDGDLDFAVCGLDSTNARRSRIWVNGGTFTWTAGPGFAVVDQGAIRFGDYDGDARLDVLVYGTGNSGPVGRIYHNDGGTFHDIGANLRPLGNSRAAWGDLDNDGRLDFIVQGTDASVAQTPRTLIYRNGGDGTFAVVDSLPGLSGGELDLMDADLDGRLDVLQMGVDALGAWSVTTWRNIGGGHFQTLQTFPAMASPSGRWYDRTGDGQPEISYQGGPSGSFWTTLDGWATPGGGQMAWVGMLGGMRDGSVSLADAFCDGNMQELATGRGNGALDTTLIRICAAAGVSSAIDLGGSGSLTMNHGVGMWADFSGDEVPDMLLMGANQVAGRPLGAWYVSSGALNNPPSSPGHPTATVQPTLTGAQVTFTWGRSSDDHTPARSITYELRVGTTPGGAEITGLRASLATGQRRVAAFGSQGSDSLWTLDLAPGTYYWSMQAVDASLAGSPFTPEQRFTIGFGSVSGSPSPLRSNSRVAAAWGDYDSDGRQDLLLAGSTDGATANAKTLLYRNTVAGLALQATALPHLTDASVAWGDVDHDGDLDVALCGLDVNSISRTYVYRNNAGTFALSSTLRGVSRGALALGDYDSDGKLDLLVAGSTNTAASGALTFLYHGNGDGTFVNSGQFFRNAYLSTVGFADVDRDGDMDFLVTGRDSVGVPMLQMYRNAGGSVFTPVPSGLPALDFGPNFSFFDFDADGDLDIAINGSSIAGSVAGATTRVYRNDGTGTFTQVAGSGLTNSCNGAIATGDVDGNGLPDIVYTGLDAGGLPVNRVALNSTGSGAFVASDNGLSPVALSALALGELDGDGHLDVALSGALGSGSLSQVFVNFSNLAETAPTAPSNLRLADNGTRMVLRWNASSDAQTASAGLGYDVRIGRSANGNQVMPLHADSLSGLRRVPSMGSFKGDSLVLPVLAEGDYFCAVQAVDPSGVGSPLASAAFTFNRMTATGGSLAGAVTPNAGSYRPPLVAWADFDNDGDLDLLASVGTTGATANARTRLYRNLSSTLFAYPTTFPNLAEGAAAWADYDRDGRLDLAIAGVDSTGARLARVYHNNGNGTFTDIAAGLTGVASASVAWADYDNDGDPDLLVGGSDNGTLSFALTRLYRNNGNGTFTWENGISLPGAFNGQAIWGDVDRDGDPDIVTVGQNSAGVAQLVVCRNNGGFFASTTTIAGMATTAGSVALGDYDNDGDLDLVVTGNRSTDGVGIVQVLDNDGTGTFTAHGSNLLRVTQSRAAWGDYDGDGDLDLAVCGTDSLGAPASRIIRDDGAAGFRVLDVALPDVGMGNMAWGHVNADNRMDLAFTGFDGTAAIAGVWTRLTGGVNAPPNPPTGLTGTLSGAGRASLHWVRSTDSKTPTLGMSYDVRLGISSRGGQIVPLPSDSTTGTRRIARGGVCTGDSAWVKGLPNNLYYFTVQAVDPSFAGSTLPAWQTLLSPALLDVEDEAAGLPLAFAIHDVSPNPAHGPATVRFDLPRAAHVDLAVYDVSGRRVRTLLNAVMAAGRQAAQWDGVSEDGARASAGYYFVRLDAGGHTRTRRVVLAR